MTANGGWSRTPTSTCPPANCRCASTSTVPSTGLGSPLRRAEFVSPTPTHCAGSGNDRARRVPRRRGSGGTGDRPAGRSPTDPRRRVVRLSRGTPQTTLLDQDAYPDLWSKAAALLHSIVKHHPLVDGNTRLGWLSTAVFLELNGVDGTGIGNDEVFDFVITVPVGTDDIEHVASALRSLVEGAAGRARAPKRSLADLGAPPNARRASVSSRPASPKCATRSVSRAGHARLGRPWDALRTEAGPGRRAWRSRSSGSGVRAVRAAPGRLTARGASPPPTHAAPRADVPPPDGPPRGPSRAGRRWGCPARRNGPGRRVPGRR